MRYLSKCPHCHTVYHLSLMQMNIAQGNVRCAQCKQRFDAYRCFVHDPECTEDDFSQNYLTEVILPHVNNTQDYHPNIKPKNASTYVDYVHHVMQQRIEDSRLDLYTYLNYLDLISPVHSNTQSQRQTASASHPHQKRIESFTPSKNIKMKKHHMMYYIIWGIINFSLLALLVFQILYL